MTVTPPAAWVDQAEAGMATTCPVCLGNPTAPDHRCHCGLDEETDRCVDGEVFGPCPHEMCPGVCVYSHDCHCPCHQPTAPMSRT
ncbi:hypothetical protein MXD63_14345 [Frankia sp. Cpl3]|nr:hypothetical protein [Frankia sp. Cpl3]